MIISNCHHMYYYFHCDCAVEKKKSLDLTGTDVLNNTAYYGDSLVI